MRPVVLVATTNPAIAYAMKVTLVEPCRKLGLRLDINSGGEKDVAFDICYYDSAEAMFDYLEQRPPMELADTLIVLYLAADELTSAFAPRATTGGWHVTQNRTGVAAEMLLRFPQVFPVFVSVAVPAVSINPETVSSGAIDTKFVPKGSPIWNELLSELAAKEPKTPLEDFKYLMAGTVPLHFVSPLDGAISLGSTLTRFARGMRCWFDPTGLRTLVKNRFLGTLFGSTSDWENTQKHRSMLLGRLTHVAISVDEEREFALLSSYCAYRVGRRAWIITTYSEFADSPLWSREFNQDAVVLRDVDLRFPDFPPGQSNLRSDLADIRKDPWKFHLGDAWKARTISHDENVVSIADAVNWTPDEKRLGQRYPEYAGLSKPIGSLYDLRSLLNRIKTDSPNKSETDSFASALLLPVRPLKGAICHGAPYVNLAMAESLILQSNRCKHGPIENLIGAFLAGEATELLLGMSQTTVLEALLLQHKKEVTVEVEFPGVSHAIDIGARRKDIEDTVTSVLGVKGGTKKIAGPQSRIRDMYLSQFWAELKMEYRRGEQFAAAEAANRRSLVHSRWIPFLVRVRGFDVDAFQWTKSLMVNIASSLVWWLCAFLFANTVSVLLYLPLARTEAIDCLLQAHSICEWDTASLVLSTLVSSITLQPTALVSKLIDDPTFAGPQLLFATIFHMGASYLLFGLLISMLYRKVTRD